MVEFRVVHNFVGLSNRACLSGSKAELAQNYDVSDGISSWSLRYPFLINPEQGIPVPYDPMGCQRVARSAR